MPDSNEKETNLYEYWMSWIKRSKKKQPIEAWKRAEEMLLVNSDNEKDKPPFLSGFRLLYESLKSYLDEKDPTFDVVPSKAFFGDDISLKAAECDGKYLDYVWDEQKLQKVQSQKLDSALIRNVGYTCLAFDTKKWMPKLRYLKPTKVFVDPDCDGISENSKAMAYEEDISYEEFVSKYKVDDIKSILNKAGSKLSEKEQEELSDGTDKKMFRTIKIYHIFAKGDAALRKGDSETDIPEEKEVKSLNTVERKRYLQFTEGYRNPLFDGEWPYDLDNNEFPITEMMFNTVSGDYYSYTDNDHMARIDEFCDNLLSDVEINSQMTGRKKFAGSPLSNDLPRATVEDFLNNPKMSYLENMIDANGKPKIAQLDVGQFDFGIIQAYKIAAEIRQEASALGELLSASATEYKDVTAIAAKIHDANAHQRVNRRLSGPFGYEQSIKEDAIKILEIAHQYVPKYSVVEVNVTNIDDFGGETENTELQSLVWRDAIAAMANGGTLIKLGVDAIVGSELAEFWREGQPQLEFKLSTNVRVKKGSTRDTTQENKAAMMKQYYNDVLQPLYVETNRLDLAAEYAKRMGQMAGIDHIDELVPTSQDAQVAMAKKQEAENIQKAGAVAQLEQQQQPQPQGGV